MMHLFGGWRGGQYFCDIGTQNNTCSFDFAAFPFFPSPSFGVKVLEVFLTPRCEGVRDGAALRNV